MDNKNIFKKYYRRLAREGIVKALLFGIAAGFAVNFVTALVTWLAVTYKGLYIAIGAGVAVGVITALVLYYAKFRPTTHDIAKRIDSLGLEERLITMNELENDPSFIAMKQREDAKKSLNEFDISKIHMIIARPLIIIAIIIGVLGLSMTTVSALTEFGILPSAEVLFPEPLTEEDFATIEYIILDGEGEIKGEVVQVIKKGESGETVIAEPAQGWAFVTWDDGVENPERRELNVTHDMTLTCMFIKVNDNDGLAGNKQGKKDPEGEPDPNSDPNSNQAIYEPSNQIIDGETAYQHEYDNFYQQMLDELETNPNLTPKQRKALESYFETLKTSDWEEDGK